MRGRPLDSPEEGAKRQRTIRVTDTVWERVQLAAEEKETTAAKWIERAIRNQLRRQDRS